MSDLVQVAALHVETGGVYFGLPAVEPWDIVRDARRYTGPWPVVCHPDCRRWGRFWHGSTRKPHQFRLGEDEGRFASSLTAARNYGGVVEHPAGSKAWRFFGLATPRRGGGWIKADDFGGWTCCVDQGHYGHPARKESWVYAVGIERPELIWGAGPQRIHPRALELHGYEKARKIGYVAMVGGKDKQAKRERTPVGFRDLLLAMARTVTPRGRGHE